MKKKRKKKVNERGKENGKTGKMFLENIKINQSQAHYRLNVLNLLTHNILLLRLISRTSRARAPINFEQFQLCKFITLIILFANILEPHLLSLLTEAISISLRVFSLSFCPSFVENICCAKMQILGSDKRNVTGTDRNARTIY